MCLRLDSKNVLQVGGPSGGPFCWVEKSLLHENLERPLGKFFWGEKSLSFCFFGGLNSDSG